jgi:RNA polymerase-binding transcription factor DksA
MYHAHSAASPSKYRSRLKPHLRKAYDAMSALRGDLQEEWEDCVEQLRSARLGTTHDDDDAVETSQAFLCHRTEQLAGEIREVEAALSRIAAGAYGICTECNKPIPAARLAARPDAVRCRHCQETFEGFPSYASAERRAPVDFGSDTHQRARPSLPRTLQSNRAGTTTTKELSRMAGSKKGRSNPDRKKASEPAAKTPAKAAKGRKSKKR